MRRALLFASFLVLAACSEKKDSPSGSGDGSGSSQAPPPVVSTKPALTQAEVDLYVQIALDMAKSAKTPEGQKAVMEKNKTTSEIYGDIWLRVRDARYALIALEKRSVPVPAHLAADVELLKQNAANMAAAEVGHR